MRTSKQGCWSIYSWYINSLLFQSCKYRRQPSPLPLEPEDSPYQMPGGFKVTDYGRIEKWIRNANAGSLFDERSDRESEQHLPEVQSLVRGEPHYDNIPGRSSTPCGQHADHGEIHRRSVLYESFELDTNRLGRTYYEAVGNPFVTKSPELDADHVEEVCGRIEALALHESSEHTTTLASNEKLRHELIKRSGELKKPDPFQMARDEMMMGVIEAHDKAEERLKELQQSCDATQTLYNDLRGKMAQAERTGQLQSNLREEWRLYGEIVEQVDDCFLRKPERKRCLKSEEFPARRACSVGSGKRKEGNGVEVGREGQVMDFWRNDKSGEGGGNDKNTGISVVNRADQKDSASEYSVESK
jgi:hypothetical protein